MLHRTVFAVAVMAGVSTSAMAVVNPFTETFSSAAANWSSASAFTPLNYPVSGGPDGSAYGSGSFSFATAAAGAQPIMFRGQGGFNSSGNAFVGDWLASGVTALSFSLRHNAPVAVDFFARFAPAGGPGAVALASTSALPNVWTTFTIPIDPSTPFIFEGTTFAGAFSNVSNLQFGVLVSAGLAGQAGPFTFDIDNVSIVPAPGVMGVAGVGGLLLVRRRRA